MLGRSSTFLLIATVTVVYSMIAYGLSQSVLSTLRDTVYEQFIFVGLAVFLALTFQPLKKYFDRATNRLFFRDSYDIDSALDYLGRILAEQIDLEVIIHSVNIHLVNTMKVQNMSLLVLDGEGVVYKKDSFGDKQEREITQSELEQFNNYSLSTLSQLENNKRDQIMRKYEVDVVSRLQTIDGIVGFMLVGPKAGGGTFTLYGY